MIGLQVLKLMLQGPRFFGLYCVTVFLTRLITPRVILLASRYDEGDVADLELIRSRSEGFSVRFFRTVTMSSRPS